MGHPDSYFETQDSKLETLDSNALATGQWPVSEALQAWPGGQGQHPQYCRLGPSQQGQRTGPEVKKQIESLKSSSPNHQAWNVFLIFFF